jgi:hypothetical protein
MDVNEYLAHHGIKGQKWGVRRFQDKNGRLTTAGKKRYLDDSNGKIKVTHRTILEKKYRDAGMSDEEARAAADKRIKVEKVVAVAAGLTVAACAAYYAKSKFSADWCDQTLKAGTTFHNLDSTANPRPGEHLYVNYRQNDVNYFRGHFAIGKMRKTGQVFNHTLTATEDIKIPSLNTRKSVFKELYDKDEQFRTVFKLNSGNTPDAKVSSSKVYKDMWQKFGNKDDEAYNLAKRKYFEALRQKGYEAIVDEWDSSKGVFRSDAPLILLNTSSKSFGEMGIKELSNRDILLSQANAKHYAPSRTLLTILGTPHANHFKESDKQLGKYAAKSVKNAANIDKVLGLLSDEQKRSYALSEDGAMLANAGRYLSKHKNMDVTTAIAKAKSVKSATEAAKAVGALGIVYAPTAAVITGHRNLTARQYLKEHPNTKLTYKQIKQMSDYNDQIMKYMEKHPNTKLTRTEIFKLYYGGKL